MIYHVTARLREETAGELLQRLTDGSIAAQRPDGMELVASMERAVIGPDGRVEWSEMCYCTPPLAHERETVLDRHFDDIRTEPIQDYRSYSGTPLMAHLRARA